ncbi:MAG TPA: cache domain-containing protein [Anaerolineales bacterium]|nr:cache domain-containing protein [Anaerolineales bacterium]
MFAWLNTSRHVRSLHAQAIVRIVLPLSLIIAGLVVASLYTYNRVVTSLITERHRQLADLAAASVSEGIEGYASVLETLATEQRLLSQFPEERAGALSEAEEVLGIFDAGVLIVDEQGLVITSSGDNLISLLSDLSTSETFRSARAQLVPSFSNVLFGDGSNDAFVLVAVPLFDSEDQFAGAVIGGINLHSTSISNPIRDLTIGKDGFTYLVDREGIIIAHPDPQQIGADYGNLPFIKRLVAGESGGMLTESSKGRRLVEGYAPIGITGWGLVIQESWDSVTEPIALVDVLAIAIGLAAIMLIAVFLWKGFDRISAPIQSLHDSTEKLAKGENIEPIEQSGIDEIDALGRAFIKMGAQISAYRIGLRRYVGAVTKSQEEERLRIARELHDDTIQSLLALSRRLELYQSSESNMERQEQIAELRDMAARTQVGVRQISRDLRPLMLEDMGLIPALQTLVRAARVGDSAIPHSRFETKGQQFPISPELELALYRITQEALTNIRRHAHATRVRVELCFGSGVIKLEVVDDGKGFEEPSSLTDFAQLDHFGLLGIQERVWAVAGSLIIHSSPGQGTSITVTIPVSNSNSGH